MSPDGMEALKTAGIAVQGLAGRELEQALTIGRRMARRATSAATARIDRIDVGDMSEDDVRSWLADRLDPDEEVVVVYPTERTAYRLFTYAAFCRVYDDLWDPSREDVIVVGRRAALLLDHEEVFHALSR